ncbi:indoleamine 2,3-dioxygenase 2 [Suncus etruscus]|uniref:indoleamine 2,3-dioxygenase 2 n=1 Tax=Suncus etruscus TaxID=109475 RepID=UPI00210F9FA2|nr:indoleamine 2,3-dioxygenase 2 [Suncus etruscus]
MEPQNQNVKTALSLSLERFHISEEYGFLLPNPLKKLPDHFKPWMEIISILPNLIESRQLQAQVNKMPLLDCQLLKGYREHRLAHLVLSFITMGYVWQEGETQPKKVLPQNLALPFVEVSKRLGLPPILVHSDLVLSNWTLRDPEGPMEIRNLDTIFLFPGDKSLRGFILVTLLVEKAAVPGIKALVRAVNSILQQNRVSLLQALQELRLSIQDMTRALGQMHDYVDSDIFYAVIRCFLSGWKDNPAMPLGLIYEGVSKEPLEYSGGSAAQSTVLHAFDEFLGICHDKESAEFLQRMRDYMPPSHRAFLEEIRLAPSLRDHILFSGDGELLITYNKCVEALTELRSYHITIVSKYIIIASSKAKSSKSINLPGSSQDLEERGTGGTSVLRFLKSVRNKTLETVLQQCG